MKRFLWLGFVASVYLICTGCGDTFRPIIIPNPPTFPNPKAAHTVVSINHNFECADLACDSFALVPGSAMVVDVSGDTDVSEVDVNLAPLHAAQQSANQVLVVNQAVTGVTPPSSGCLVISGTQTLNVCPTLTKLFFNGTVISSATNTTLPPSSAANFVAVAPLDTTAYVSLPSYVPDPVNNPTVVVPSVGVVNTLNFSLTATIPVGKNPYALAVTPDKSKLYVANEGDGTLSAFNTVDRSNRGVSPPNTSSPPIWLVARTDNQRVYVLEETTGALAEIDTTATAGPDPLNDHTGISVPGATTMVYDSNKNRLYIPGGPVMAIVDVSQSPPVLLATITIPKVPVLPNSNSVAASAVAAAALPDGSQAYVASIPSSALSSQATISAVQGDGTNATFTYTWTGGHDLASGIQVTVSGIPSPNDGFNGTYTITATSGTSCDQPTQVCTFQAANSTVLTTKATVTGLVASTGDNLFPQITAVDVASNTIKSSFSTSGFPDATVAGSPYYAPICASTRFRFMMAAGGDSSRTYLSSCDGGNVNIVDTSVDKYVLNLPAPLSLREPIPPSVLNPPQNPVFLLAGP